ncbi:MAG TPA: hypothetical protein VF971_02110 [Candidatus Limnocylindrales bacterium]
MTTPNERPDVPPVPSGSADPASTMRGEPAAPTAPAPTAPAQTAGADLKTVFEDGARALDERAQALGREAEAAARRWGENPAVKETADLAGRLWGVVLLAVGFWFLADVTLDLDLPRIRWGELWPLVLIVVGGFVVLRGMARRR